MKRFVLMSSTRGDGLIASRRDAVAESASRETLETLRESRAKEREEYLAHNPLPWWAMAGVISGEEIVEVDSL
jgi:hypothetical protein